MNKEKLQNLLNTMPLRELASLKEDVVRTLNERVQKACLELADFDPEEYNGEDFEDEELTTPPIQ